MKFMTASALVALQFAACSFAVAQDAAPAADSAGDAIIVTGTRDAKRTRFDALAPIDVLPSKAIDGSISNDLSDTLAQLLPSFNVQRLPAADGQAFVRPATLRGLSADQTLVLINGKRYHRSALLGTRGAQATLPPSPIWRSSASKCCAMARRRNMGRMRSLASSTSS